MLKRTVMASVLAGAGLICGGPASAAVGEVQVQAQGEMQQEEMVYGSQLMTPEERAEYRARMRAATTAEEREKIRREHHGRMQERAKSMGVTLPDAPPERGMQRGMGPGQGQGMGAPSGTGSEWDPRGGMGGGRR